MAQKKGGMSADLKPGVKPPTEPPPPPADHGGGSLGRLPRVMFQLDPKIPAGEIHVGGTLVLDDPDDEDLGWAVQARLVRVGDEETLSTAIFKATQGSALELKRLPDIPEERF